MTEEEIQALQATNKELVAKVGFLEKDLSKAIIKRDEAKQALADNTGDEELRKELDIKVFVSADSDDRLMRIMQRDIRERGRTYEDVLEHYSKYVKLMHREFIAPTKRFADIIIPEGGNNHVGIEILTSRIDKKLRDNT